MFRKRHKTSLLNYKGGSGDSHVEDREPTPGRGPVGWLMSSRRLTSLPHLLPTW